MKLEAIGEFVVLQETKTNMGQFTMTETHKGKVISVGKDVEELKIELGLPTDDFINESGNKILIYKT